jgi:hypothetical protein
MKVTRSSNDEVADAVGSENEEIDAVCRQDTQQQRMKP